MSGNIATRPIHFVRRERVVDLRAQCLGESAANRTAMKLAVRQPRSMGQQISERDRSPRLVRRERSFRIAQHAQVRELGRADRDRIVQRESALVEQHQRGDGGHRLGHRRDPEDGVALDSKATRQVAAPDRRHAGDLAVAPRQRRGAGQLSGVDEGPDRGVHRDFTFHMDHIK
jgi:hypothetical protein